MPTVMKISPQGQLRIPNKIMNALGITKGDYVEVDVKDNDIILKPRKLIDPSQGWYWTKEWQEIEARVDDEYQSRACFAKTQDCGRRVKMVEKITAYQFSRRFKKEYSNLPKEIQKNL